MSPPPKPILALDTGAGASACLLLADGQVKMTSAQISRAHSKTLLPMLQGLLDAAEVGWQSLQAFAVGVGPGSFTGLRVACATIAGVNASLQKPVYSLSSLAITARQTVYDKPFWAIEDARSGLVYAAQFEGHHCITPAMCLSWQDFMALNPRAYISIPKTPFTIEAKALPVLQARKQALADAVRALDAAAKSALWVEPLYLQPSQAEKNLS